MALTGNEVISLLAPDGAGHPAAVLLPVKLSDMLTAGLADRNAGSALTAAGTTRADALALTKQINNIGTAAASTGVVLPAATVGQIVTVFNSGANPIKVYGAGSDTIDGTAGSTGVTLTNANRCMYICVAAATWLSAQMGVASA